MQTIDNLITYQKGKNYADRVIDLLKDHCEVIHLAGSVARESPLVKDVEVCCIPKKEFVPTDLFGGGSRVVCEDFKKAVEFMSQEIKAGEYSGRYMKIILKGNVKLDLFMPVAEDYYRILTIRTGSADFVKKFISSAWKTKGWCGTNDGLRKIKDCFPVQDKQGKTKWICRNQNAEKPPVWASEEEFFKWLNVRWIAPIYR